MKRKKTILFLFVGLLLCGNFLYLFRISPEKSNFTAHLTLSWAISTFIIVFFFNYVIDLFLDKILDWKQKPVTRFLIQMVFGTLISLLAINISYQILKSNFTETAPDLNQLVLLNIYGAFLIIPLFAFRFGFKFLGAWRKSELEAEKLSKENARSQMMTLKNHLDPHFLFNNLNILSSLMDKDVGLSQSYLDKFAEVYRIILKTEVSDLTTLKEELKLIESYMYLLKIRFDKSLIFKQSIADSDLEKVLPPLSIQMLVENAIKHNMLNKDNPITIEIKSDGDNYLLVSNNKQVKKYMDKERKGTGLENIQQRYQFFTDKAVIISDQEDEFTVKLPLLEIE